MDSRCWFTEEEAGTPDFPIADPNRDSLFNDVRWNELIEILNHEAVTIEEITGYVQNQFQRARRFRTGNSDCPIATSMQQHGPGGAANAAEETVNQYFDQDCWSIERRHLLSAELSTVLAMSELGIFRQGDTIELVGGHSNMAETELTCQALRRLATEGRFSFDAEAISCRYDLSLDPTEPVEFVTSMNQLWSDISDHANEFRLVLTGGYKGVGLSLATRIEHHTTKIYYMHEDASSLKSENYGLVTMTIKDGHLG